MPEKLTDTSTEKLTEDIFTIDELANRRQYFRIQDDVAVEIAPLEPSQGHSGKLELGPAFGLISEFQLLDLESKHLLRALADKDKVLSQYLKVLNQKVDALSRVIALQNLVVATDSIQRVNLSEGGLALQHPHAMKRGDRLDIKLILLPSYSGLVLKGRVLSCEAEKPACGAGKPDTYRIHIEFTDISDAHQQLIARHIMRKQKELATPAEQK